MESDFQGARFVFEQCVVPRTDEVFHLHKNRVARIFRPRAGADARRGGITDAIILALVVVSRICEVIDSVMFNNVRTFVYAAQGLFPRLRNVNTFLQRADYGSY